METYTSPKRVVRDGHLVAFEGEVMSTDEAVRRGLAAGIVLALLTDLVLRKTEEKK